MNQLRLLRLRPLTFSSMRHQKAIPVLLTLAIGISPLSAFQDKVRWSKDYIHVGGQLVATVPSIVLPGIGAACRVYLPYVIKGEAFSTILAIQNKDSVHPATVTIRYIDPFGGQTAAISRQIGPLQSAVLDLNAAGSGFDAIPAWQGSAVIEASVPIAVVAMQSPRSVLSAFLNASTQGNASQIPASRAFAWSSHAGVTHFQSPIRRKLPAADMAGRGQVGWNVGFAATAVRLKRINDSTTDQPNLADTFRSATGLSVPKIRLNMPQRACPAAEIELQRPIRPAASSRLFRICLAGAIP